VTDLRDTSRCPVGARCEACGLEAANLAVCAIECALGVLCLTLCPRCGRARADTTARSIAVPTASRLVAQHADHLGVAIEAVQALQRAGGRRPWDQPGAP
jgi:hypothetical protein